MNARILSALAVAVALAGCASNPVFEGERAWSDGWREGKVKTVGTASDLGERRAYDCRYRNGGAGHDASGRFAVVEVQIMGKHRHLIASVEPGKDPALGSPVLVNLRGCKPPIATTGR